jgi:hypothetical protein
VHPSPSGLGPKSFSSFTGEINWLNLKELVVVASSDLRQNMLKSEELVIVSDCFRKFLPKEKSKAIRGFNFNGGAKITVFFDEISVLWRVFIVILHRCGIFGLLKIYLLVFFGEGTIVPV